MKKLILISLLMLAAKFGFSQTIYTYYTVDSFVVQVTVKEKPKFTGKYFITANGQIYPIMVSSQGHFFIERVSKNGKKYKQYL
jgi:hypothetical protein